MIPFAPGAPSGIQLCCHFVDCLQRLLTASVQSLDDEHIQGSVPRLQSQEELLMGSDPSSWGKLVMIFTDLGR